MNMGLAPRPANEDLRAQTVVKTGPVSYTHLTLPTKA